jgi:predicted nucleic acid-binding protein
MSEPRKTRPEPRVSARFAQAEENSLYLSVITLGELRDGCERLDPGKRQDALDFWLKDEFQVKFDNRILPVTEAVADRWGRIRARREKLGMRLHTQDGLIAATSTLGGSDAARDFHFALSPKNFPIFSFKNFPSSGFDAAPAVCPHSEGMGISVPCGMNGAS